MAFILFLWGMSAGRKSRQGAATVEIGRFFAGYDGHSKRVNAARCWWGTSSPTEIQASSLVQQPTMDDAPCRAYREAGFAGGWPLLAGGTIPFIRRYSTICP